MPSRGSHGPPRKREAPAAPSDTLHLSRHGDGEGEAGWSGGTALHEIHVDQRIAALARRQQNLISIEQMRALEITEGEWDRRLRSGHLHRKHRGVFAVGSPLLPPLGRERAALLAVPDTVLTLGSAAGVYGYLPLHPSGDVHLLSTTNRRDRKGIKVHWTTHLPAEDVRTYRGFPLTSPVRLVLDMTSHLSATALERLMAEVTLRDPSAHEELARRGTEKVRALLGTSQRTRSSIERALLKLTKEARIPRPHINATVAGEEVDAWWPEHRLVVEVDTYATHGDRLAFERDRRKDAALTARGITVVRITDRALAERPIEVAATLAQALARAA